MDKILDRDIRFAEDKPFAKRRLAENVWVITSSKGCDVHLVIGPERAAVMDTGESRRSLRKYIETITDKPLVVLNSHGHFDHTGSNAQFSDCPIYMSDFAAAGCKDIGKRELNIEDFGTDYEPTVIKEGDIIDLGGGHTLEAIKIGCHSPGSLAYLDRTARMLFTGDELEAGQVLIQGIRMEASVERYRDNMLKLKEHYDEFDLVCPAHNGTPIYKEIIIDSIENCDRILSGIEGKPDITSPTFSGRRAIGPDYRRSEWKNSSIVYSTSKLHYSDELPLVY